MSIDTPGPIREGEELDLAKLEVYLKDTLGSFDGSVTVEQFRKGHSNLTYLVHAGDRDLVLRRPPFSSKVKSAHDMSREYTVLSHISPIYSPAPKPVAYCEDQSVIGADFYLMERIQGAILRGKKPKDMEVAADTPRACCESFVDNLVALHSLDYKAAGLGDLYRPGHYCERQVIGWCDRYEGSKTDDIPSIDRTAAWLKERIPPDCGAVLIHNDYKYDNIVLDPNDISRIIGVLDWEMATIGDPLMDLGTALGYWIEADDPDEMKLAQCFLTCAPTSMTRLEIAQRYAEKTGHDVSDILFYYVFSLLKIAVILQQIYYRYKMGHTKDDRFAPLIFFVHALGKNAVNAIDAGQISKA